MLNFEQNLHEEYSDVNHSIAMIDYDESLYGQSVCVEWQDIEVTMFCLFMYLFHYCHDINNIDEKQILDIGTGKARWSLSLFKFLDPRDIVEWKKTNEKTNEV